MVDLANCTGSSEAEAVETLIEGAAAETSWLGIGLTAGTLLICPWLGLAKQHIAGWLGSRATYGEGTAPVLCALLAKLTPSTFGSWSGVGQAAGEVPAGPSTPAERLAL